LAEEDEIFSILPFERRVYRGRLGGLSRQRKRLLQQPQTPEVREKLADIDMRLSGTKIQLEETKPTKPVIERRQKIWECTRYYKYESRSKPSDNRNFEVRILVPFPDFYKLGNVQRHKRDAEAACDTAMALAFRSPEVTRGRYDADAWDVLDANIPWEPTSIGWEESELSEEMSRTETVTVEARVTDKIGKYWKGPITVYVPNWSIPDWISP
jgi:hypothetical protein